MKQFLVFVLLFGAGLTYGQKMKVVKGKFTFLKGQTDFNVEFTYDKMRLYKEKKTNEQYMEERAKELNEKSKGQGDIWKKKWMSSRELIFEAKFLELINKYSKGRSFTKGETSAKHTLIVETVWLYPGWNAGVMRQPAKVSTVLKFVETANKDKVLLQISAKEAIGKSFMGTFSNEDRLGEGYAKTGKSLAKLIDKKG